jgi:desulfoferrodoxin (superoxide reductase-like protein)
LRNLTGGIVSTGEIRIRFVSWLLVLGATSLFAACTKAPAPQRTITERDGTIGGLTSEIAKVEVESVDAETGEIERVEVEEDDVETLEVEAGDVIRIVLRQEGRDAWLQLSIAGQKLGRFDSATGRYGEDRVQVEVDRSGKLQVLVGASRLPDVSGPY